ncbi:hypothetical protein G9A89_003756 [Geosiphon pyriformis]|nr:hypothetical protein G9A89_003756 [Geosiphon pyriformis]
MEFVRYFSNNNSINKLANLFTTIKQGNTEAVTTYLGCFHRNLRQIQAIQADYFTAPQILNQFIRGLRSNLLQRVRPMHPVDLFTAVTHARDFEAAELEANHAQAVNLVMNGSSELDSKLKQFSESINQKLEGYLADNCTIYQTPQQCHNSGNVNHFQNQSWLSSSTAPSLPWQPEMRAYLNCGKQGHIRKSRSPVPNFESLSKSRSRPISNYLPANDAATNLSTTTAAPNNLLISTINSNTALKFSYDNIRKPETQNCSKLEIGNGCLSTSLQLLSPELKTPFSEFGYRCHPKPDFPTLFKNPPKNNKHLPATVTNDKSLATIFPFEIEESSSTLLFSGAALDEKPITAMYTDAKIDGQSIKLILNSGLASTASARIITANETTKTPIGKIDDFLFKVNGIVTPIKVLVMEATQYQALIGNNWLSKVNATLDWNTQELQETIDQIGEGERKTYLRSVPSLLLPILAWDDNNNGKEKQGKEPTCETTIDAGTNNKNHYELPPVLSWDDNPKRKQKEELIWETNDLTWTDNEQEEASSRKWNENKRKEKEKKERTPPMTNSYNFYTYHTLQQFNYRRPRLVCIDCGKKLLSMGACCADDKEYHTATKFYCHPCLLECFGQPKRQGKWDNQSCLTCGKILLDEGICPHDNDELWRMAITKIEGVTPEEIREIKNNPPEPIELNWNTEPAINSLEPKEFHEHYQNLAPTREELCHCLISNNFEYCDDCDLLYNSPPRMIYLISKEEEQISSCTSESESLINCDPNSDDDNENIGSSSVQNDNDNKNDSNSDSNSNLNHEQYIALPDLSKKQELKWYSDNRKSIMPERVHDMDAGFDLKYPGKDAIKLELHSRTCIDLKIALEIPATTMVQLASKSSLAKRGINIRGGIIDAGYVENIIAMLQNDSEKAYIIEPNEKIAQAIFLPLVRVAQLVSVEKKEELGITAKGIQGFGLTGRIDVPVNMAEEEIVGQEEIISTSQAISILSYSQYMLTIGRREKEQGQIFEAEANLCESGEIGLINLHIPAKSYSSIKILIYNNTGNIINIPEGTTIRYVTTKIEDQPPNPIPDFPQLCQYVNITSQTIYG